MTACLQNFLRNSNMKDYKNYHEPVDRIDHSVPRVTVWHHRVMIPRSGPRDRFVFPFLKCMFVSFSCIHLGANA